MEQELVQIGRDIVSALERGDQPEACRLAASLMGKIRSPRKSAASAENGKLGGRPLGSGHTPETKALIAATLRQRRQERQEEAGQAGQTAADQSKRGPGRPRTSPAQEGPTRGRGRPRKSTAEQGEQG